MKIILAIVQDKDSNRLANEFIDANIRAYGQAVFGDVAVGADADIQLFTVRAGQ